MHPRIASTGAAVLTSIPTFLKPRILTGAARCHRTGDACPSSVSDLAEREVLEIAATREITDGRHNDLRIVTMIASIKADHLRFERERLQRERICP